MLFLANQGVTSSYTESHRKDVHHQPFNPFMYCYCSLSFFPLHPLNDFLELLKVVNV